MSNKDNTLPGNRLAEVYSDQIDLQIKPRGPAVKASKSPWDTMRIEAIGWEDELFGICQIGVQGFTLGSQRESDTIVRSEIKWEGQRPSRIHVFFDFTKLAEGVRAFCLINGKTIDVTESETTPALWVPVEWRGVGKDSYPFTRQVGKDNFDLILMRPEGAFVQLQASVNVRGGNFWLAVQNLYVGQPITATAAQIERLGITSYPIAGSDLQGAIIPVVDENAYPGADYARDFKYAAERILAYAFERGAFVTFEESDETEWELVLPDELPPEMVAGGWLRAGVQWFTVPKGCATVLCEDGVVCFVHFSAIVDKQGRQIANRGQFPFLDAMSGVALKRKYNKKKGRWEATAVRKNIT
jgi:hypothetical protein